MISEFKGEYRWLSNFWPCEVMLDGKVYPTVEHAYQAAKTLNESEREVIRKAASPGEAKRLGRRSTVQDSWDDLKRKVMFDLLRQKFSRPDLRAKLKYTGYHRLQEGNTWGDRYWGVDLATGRGENWLGAILMEIRKDL